MDSDVCCDIPVSEIGERVLSIPKTEGLSPHFGTRAFMNAIDGIKTWISGGMDVQGLLSALSEARVSTI